MEALHGADDWRLVEREGGGWCYQYHGSIHSCTLTRRHWVLRSADTAEAQAEVVDGEGVIGLFPELYRGAEEAAGAGAGAAAGLGAVHSSSTKKPFTFGYQSMNTAQSVPSLFSGHVSFSAAGRAGAGPGGGDDRIIEAKIHDMKFGVPVFIY